MTTNELTTDEAWKIRAKALYEAARAVMDMEKAYVTSDLGTVVNKLDARDAIIALIDNPTKARK